MKNQIGHRAILQSGEGKPAISDHLLPLVISEGRLFRENQSAVASSKCSCEVVIAEYRFRAKWPKVKEKSLAPMPREQKHNAAIWRDVNANVDFSDVGDVVKHDNLAGLKSPLDLRFRSKRQLIHVDRRLTVRRDDDKKMINLGRADFGRAGYILLAALQSPCEIKPFVRCVKAQYLDKAACAGQHCCCGESGRRMFELYRAGHLLRFSRLAFSVSCSPNYNRPRTGPTARKQRRRTCSWQVPAMMVRRTQHPASLLCRDRRFPFPTSSCSDRLSWITYMPLSVGDRLGPYEILASIAREVWARCMRRARHAWAATWRSRSRPRN